MRPISDRDREMAAHAVSKRGMSDVKWKATLVERVAFEISQARAEGRIEARNDAAMRARDSIRRMVPLVWDDPA